MWREKAGPRWTVHRRASGVCVFQRSHGQKLIKRLALAQAQAHGEVDGHHSGLRVTRQRMEHSEEEG